ncbi:MAG: hypothetical protein PHP30_08050 [Bacteroidales bacterium]|jgi:anti-sigma-K factor RskA|nr:hypothetical protein [Bacteroidales bacterium]MDD2425555.1 hypothetical protein [Bacteroidales bacterium]MDD3990029.1 hypothetical protein [Bacteroidales bacterium]
MKTEKYIEDLIQREKATEPNPYLSARVMAQIAKENFGKEDQPVITKTPVWQTVIAATSIVAFAFLGVLAGNSYSKNVSYEIAININDRQIESLDYYNFEDYE